MNKYHIKAAWTEQPIPPDLPENEKAAYVTLAVIYRNHRNGEITKEEGEVFKEQLLHWSTCPPMERAALLRYAFTNEIERGREGADVWDNLTALFLESSKPLERDIPL